MTSATHPPAPDESAMLDESATPDELAALAAAALGRLRDRRPLVHCLTNEVTTNLVANALLALGAAPAMTSVPGEAEQLAGVASAVLVNLGTPGPDQRACVETAVAAAARAGVPWVLDPVAVGVLAVRTAMAERLVAARPGVVRGNASEILALAGFASAGRGVDAHDEVDASRDAAVALAATTSGVVAVSGEVDLVADAGVVVRVAGGDRLLTAITGAGCALGAVTAAFTAVTAPLPAAVAASLTFALAAERAAVAVHGPASFQVALLDELFRLEPANLAARADRLVVSSSTSAQVVA